MANGQEKGKENLAAFKAWIANQTDEDFKQIIYRGHLNRGEIAIAIGCGKSALNQNPGLKTELQSLEDALRERSVLPPLTESAKSNINKPKQYDNTANRKSLDSKRLSTVEAENVELKARIKELEEKLERLGELDQSIFEMGLILR